MNAPAEMLVLGKLLKRVASLLVAQPPSAVALFTSRAQREIPTPVQLPPFVILSEAKNPEVLRETAAASWDRRWETGPGKRGKRNRSGRGTASAVPKGATTVRLQPLR